MESSTNNLKQASDYVFDLFKSSHVDSLTYHNYDHTVDTVEACREIAGESNLTRSELEIVLLSAWFHDTGYTEPCTDPEEKSVEIAVRFLQENGYPPDKIAQVAGCIRATKLPQQPKTLVEEVLCDGDLMHIGKKGFFEKNSLLRMELERKQAKPFTEIDWLSKSADFLSQQQFHTRYAQMEFDKRRGRNLIKLQERLREAAEHEQNGRAAHGTKKEKTEDRPEKEKTTLRGIETMIRLTTNNHIHFSSIADHKASMLISTNSLMMTLIVTLYGRGIMGEERVPRYILVPVLVLMASALATIVFAILSTIPKITSGRFTREDILQKKANLLFFGNFFNMDLQEYEWGMKEMMKDGEYLYGTMIKDIYYLGQVLGKKFHYLRISYNIFMFGLIATLLTFVTLYLVY